MDAAILSTKRLGWKLLGPFRLQLDDGAVVHLTSTPPVLMEMLSRKPFREDKRDARRTGSENLGSPASGSAWTT